MSDSAHEHSFYCDKTYAGGLGAVACRGCNFRLGFQNATAEDLKAGYEFALTHPEFLVFATPQE